MTVSSVLLQNILVQAAETIRDLLQYRIEFGSAVRQLNAQNKEAFRSHIECQLIATQENVARLLELLAPAHHALTEKQMPICSRWNDDSLGTLLREAFGLLAQPTKYTAGQEAVVRLLSTYPVLESLTKMTIREYRQFVTRLLHIRNPVPAHGA